MKDLNNAWSTVPIRDRAGHSCAYGRRVQEVHPRPGEDPLRIISVTACRIIGRQARGIDIYAEITVGEDSVRQDFVAIKPCEDAVAAIEGNSISAILAVIEDSAGGVDLHLALPIPRNLRRADRSNSVGELPAGDNDPIKLITEIGAIDVYANVIAAHTMASPAQDQPMSTIT